MRKSNYEVEILVNGNSIKEYFHDGKTYIEGKKGSKFSIKLRNNSWSRKLFVPTVDGLSVMDGKEADHNSSGYILDGYNSMTIDGWRTSDKEVAEFFFSSPKDSYGVRTGKGKNLGVIGVAVFDEKQKPQPIVIERYLHTHSCSHQYCWGCHRYHCHACGNCYGTSGNGSFITTTGGNITTTSLGTMNLSASNTSSNQVNAMYSSSSQDLGTGFGDAKRSEVVSVDFNRESRPSEIFEIFYNTREQLDNMGVVFKEAVYVTPQSFPGQYCKPPRD